MKKLSRVLLTLVLGGLWLSAQAAEITVAAAASLTDAFKEASAQFSKANPDIKVQFTFAGSGALLQQITQGAPVDVFASADPFTMNQAQERNLLVANSRHDFAQNTLVVVSSAHFHGVLAKLGDLTQDSIKRIAVATPESVPVGRYSKAVLEAQKLWQPIQDKVIFTQNVRHSLDYAARGEVDAAFVYATDAAMMPGKVKTLFTVTLAEPILYPIAAIKDCQDPIAAQKFVRFVLSDEGQAILARYGFSKP